MKYWIISENMKCAGLSKTQKLSKNVKFKKWINRGHPVGVRSSEAWEKCPVLGLPTDGQSIKCNRATCAVICKPGFQPLGQARIRCRENPSGFDWSRGLPKCATCAGKPPVSFRTKCRVVKKTRVAKLFWRRFLGFHFLCAQIFFFKIKLSFFLFFVFLFDFFAVQDSGQELNVGFHINFRSSWSPWKF